MKQKLIIVYGLLFLLFMSHSNVSTGIPNSPHLLKAKDHFFKEYDLRGKVGIDFEIDNIYDIGCSIATFFTQNSPTIKNIAIGMDGRLDSSAIKDELCRAFLDSGLNVTFIGLCTTPIVYFAMHRLNFDAGIMVTASHNPKEYNGIKIVLNKQSVWGEQIRAIKDIYKTNSFMNQQQKNQGAYAQHFLCEEYVDYLVKSFSYLRSLPLQVVFDCGNGAAGSVMPLLIKKMGWENAVILNETIDGNFPSHDPDPTIEKNVKELKEYVMQHEEASFGIAFDGDCDRLAVVTKNGYLLSGDQLLAILSQALSKCQDYLPKSIIVDIMCSNNTMNQLKELGFIPYFSRTGIAYVKEAMQRHNALLGGEISGHICFNDVYFGYDDGIYAAMRLINMLYVLNKTLDDYEFLFSNKKITKNIAIHCDDDKKFIIVEEIKTIFAQRPDLKIITVDGIRIDTGYGCAICRASNTEPLIRLKLEATNEKDIQKLQDEFSTFLFDKKI